MADYGDVWEDSWREISKFVVDVGGDKISNK